MCVCVSFQSEVVRGKAEGSEGMLQPGRRRSLSPLYLDNKLLTKGQLSLCLLTKLWGPEISEWGDRGTEVLQFHACIEQAGSCTQPR